MKYLLLVLWLVSSISVADDENLQKYYAFTPSQILALSEEERRSEVPSAYAVDEKFVETIPLMVPLSLTALHYPNAFEDVESAIKLFQADLGDDQTGDLTVGQIQMLTKREDFYGRSKSESEPLAVPSVSDIYKSEYFGKYASLTGKWEIADEAIAEPNNSVEITCWEKQKKCSVQEIKIQDESTFEKFLDSGPQPGYVIVDNYDISILDWSGAVVIAKPASDGHCRATVWTMDFELEEFSQVTRNSGSSEKDCTDWYLESPRIARIETDYKKIYRDKSERARVRRESGVSVTYSGYQRARKAAFDAFRDIYSD